MYVLCCNSGILATAEHVCDISRQSDSAAHVLGVAATAELEGLDRIMSGALYCSLGFL
jgi:hypothetical protein